MLEELRTLIAEGLNVEADKIEMTTSFKDDLGADSLDLFELVMAIEDNYGIEVPAEELKEMTTVGDVVAYVEAHK